MSATPILVDRESGKWDGSDGSSYIMVDNPDHMQPSLKQASLRLDGGGIVHKLEECNKVQPRPRQSSACPKFPPSRQPAQTSNLHAIKHVTRQAQFNSSEPLHEASHHLPAANDDTIVDWLAACRRDNLTNIEHHLNVLGVMSATRRESLDQHDVFNAPRRANAVLKAESIKPQVLKHAGAWIWDLKPRK